MPAFFDTHAHLPDDCGDDDAVTIFSEARAAGVPYLMLAGTSLRDCPQNLRLAQANDGVYTCVGVHPEVIDGWDDRAIGQLRQWCLDSPKVVAIGEIGLDAHYDRTSPADQERVFAACLGLASQLDLPVVLHAREAFDRAFAMVQRLLPAGHPVQVHSFADGPAELEKWLSLNTMFSYNGMVTFKKAENIRQTLRMVPDDRLLLETDAPYLAPTPYRGQQNSSRLIPVIAQRVAEERGTTLEAIAELTCGNAMRFFRIGGAEARPVR